MTQLTPAQLGTQTAPSDGDLFVGYPAGGPMYSITAINFRTYVQMGTLLLDGSTTMLAPIKASNGSQANPSITFGSDTGTGLYRVSASKLGITVGGVNILTLDASGGIAAQGAVPFVGNLTGAFTTGRSISATGDGAWTVTFDGSTNVTAGLTLATVNANVGSFTNANITVNAKGLVTAAANGSVSAFTGASGIITSSSPFTVALSDAGKMLAMAGTTFTIPANAGVAFPVGTTFWGYNTGGSSCTVAITSDALLWFAGTGSPASGSRTIAGGGHFLLQKGAATVWYISGIGIS